MSISDSLDWPSGSPWLGSLHRLPEPTPTAAPLGAPALLPWRVRGRLHGGQRYSLHVLAANGDVAYGLAVASLGEHPASAACICLRRRDLTAAPAAPEPAGQPQPHQPESQDEQYARIDDELEHAYPRTQAPIAVGWLLVGVICGAIGASIIWMVHL